jgi:hypothetical protein
MNEHSSGIVAPMATRQMLCGVRKRCGETERIGEIREQQCSCVTDDAGSIGSDTDATTSADILLLEVPSWVG